MRDLPVSRRTTLRISALAAVAGLGAEHDSEAATMPAELRLATGPPGAVYRVVGAALAEALEAHFPHMQVHTVPSRASTDNVDLLRAGEVDIGLSSLDAAATAHGAAPSEIRALGRIYDSHLHLVVPASSRVRSLDDVSNRRVSLGARDSGTEFTCQRLLDQAGVDVEVVRLDQADSARALHNGQIDAAFSLTGIPTPAILDLARERRLRLVALPEATDLLARIDPGPYAPGTIPATAYPGLASTPTVAVPNVLLARSRLTVDTARLVTGTVFSRAEAIGANRPEASQINVRTGIATGPLPLHPGAVAWFREQKR
ncbi:TAXI family TRAP transporter solute-binding subunit [Lipingzhangella sp. LS1_29]|uniref:TAXI family TRAP transporter solute-binding subunit n=1 Tax=Lipingzhangella rawalii TaxID=2055835 RepID=A0ABU2H2N9_9ACTN|nr:TAXI family TRAP transporter solute-binding subunit [Lipingzhangella rawalii]MDS1269252.1 TAXI family TRAP transporter solute-binding subunit [Lipingzhangella rawalii]